MADRALRDTYLTHLEGALPLADDDRDAAVEEIAAHIADATAELIERGLPADLAERRALSRLGAPERLADEIAAALRTPRDLLTATGVGLRVTIGAAIQSVLVTWAIVIVVGIAVALAWSLVDRLAALPRIDWGPWINAPLVGMTMILAAHAIGRSIVRPVALAAHRPEREVRVAVLLVGLPIAALAGLAWIELEWNLIGAAMAALLPGCFAAGVLRPNLLPSRFPRNRPSIAWALIAVLAISIAGLAVVGAPSQQASTGVAREIDPVTEFIAIAPFEHYEMAPLDEIPTGGAAFDDGHGRGTGPIEWSLTWRLTSADALAGWTDLRAEIWTAERDPVSEPLVAGIVTGPVASTPLSITGRRASASLSLAAVPDREFYYLAVVGTDPDGERQLAAWPSFRQWTWYGTPLEFILASVR